MVFFVLGLVCFFAFWPIRIESNIDFTIDNIFSLVYCINSHADSSLITVRVDAEVRVWRSTLIYTLKELYNATTPY